MRHLETDDTFNPAWLSLLGGKESSRLRNLAITGMAAYGAYTQLSQKYRTWRDGRSYIIAVPDTDDVYYDVHKWVLDQLPPDKQFNLKAFTRRMRSSSDDDMFGSGRSGRKSALREVRLMYDGTRPQDIWIEGHKLIVAIEDPEVPRLGSRTEQQLGKPGSLNFRAHSVHARDALLRQLMRITDEHNKREKDIARVYIASKWGSWESIEERPPRILESVVLAAGQREEMVTDLERFFDNEKVYARTGRPWHRGYLLSGPPGTGKTSIAQALATHFGMDTYYVPLSDLDTDTDLARMLSSIDPQSLLLLEDIDVTAATRNRAKNDDKDKGANGISLSGLLNALDGVITPYGLVTIMTSNRREVLDGALIRPGRADVEWQVDYADGEQVRRLVRMILDVDVDDETFALLEPRHKVPPAAVVEAVTPFLTPLGDRSDEALAAVVELVDTHTA